MRRLLSLLGCVLLLSACGSRADVRVHFERGVLETIRDTVGGAELERAACLTVTSVDSGWHVTDVTIPEHVSSSDTAVRYRGCEDGEAAVHNHPLHHLRNDRLMAILHAKTGRRPRIAADLCYLSTTDIKIAANNPRPVSFVFAGDGVLCWWSRQQARGHGGAALLLPPDGQTARLHHGVSEITDPPPRGNR